MIVFPEESSTLDISKQRWMVIKNQPSGANVSVHDYSSQALAKLEDIPNRVHFIAMHHDSFSPPLHVRQSYRTYGIAYVSCCWFTP